MAKWNLKPLVSNWLGGFILIYNKTIRAPQGTSSLRIPARTVSFMLQAGKSQTFPAPAVGL